jgi:hypothetical protein
MEEKIKQVNPTLHRYLFTVTTFSKLLAMFLFILLPFIGFYLGIQYQKMVTVSVPQAQLQKLIANPKNQINNLKFGSLINNSDGSKIYTSSKGYSITFPSDITFSESTDGPLISLQKKGPTYTPIYGNGMTKNLDGISLTFAVESANSSTATLLDYANDDYKVRYNGVVAKSIILAGRQGYVVTLDLPAKQIYESTIYLPLKSQGADAFTQPGTYLEITDRTYDATNQGYKQVVQGILNSLRFN